MVRVTRPAVWQDSLFLNTYSPHSVQAIARIWQLYVGDPFRLLRR